MQKKQSISNNPVNDKVPLYFHWLAMEMYQFFHTSTEFESPSAICLDYIMESFMLLPKFSSCDAHEGRGVMCKEELKCSEVLHTGFFARELDVFLFGNKRQKSGASYYQYPVDRGSQSIPAADFYACGLNNRFPGSPVLLGDMKVENMTTASRETGGYCMKAIEVSSGEKCTIVNLGLAMTKDRAKLFVNLGGDKVMHQIEICQVLLTATLVILRRYLESCMEQCTILLKTL